MSSKNHRTCGVRRECFQLSSLSVFGSSATGAGKDELFESGYPSRDAKTQCFCANIHSIGVFWVLIIWFGYIVTPNYYPATDGATAEAVAKTVGVAYDPSMQDWPIEV